MKQDELGRALRQMVPPVDETGVWDSVTQRAGWRQTRARIPITKRFIGLAAAVMIVLLAAGFGIDALVDHLGQRERVLVLTDDVMSPGDTVAAAASAEQRAKYGQVLTFGNLELCVTVSPAQPPVTEADAPKSGAKRWGAKQLRSQIIVRNVGDEAQLFTAADVVLESAGGTRGVPASAGSDSVLVEPSGMLTRQLDWAVVADAKIAAVVYAPEEAADAVMVWGPGTLVEGQGYPVLRSLPTLRPEDVTSIEVRIDDPQGGPPSVEVHQAGEPGVDLERVSELYAQTTLVPTEGYPTYRHPVQVILHLTDGSALAIGLSAAGGDECTIQYTREGSVGTPPSAVGRNAALVYGFFVGGTGGAGMTVNEGAAASDIAQYLGESDVQAANEAAVQYLIAVRTGDLERLTSVLAPGSRAQAQALLDEGQAQMHTMGEEAVTPSRIKPLIWTGNAYLLQPESPLPSKLDEWVREDPHGRTVLEITMIDGSLRLTQAERQPESYEWLVIDSMPVWPMNERGQTYGSSALSGPLDHQPDLIQAAATNGRVGYVSRLVFQSVAEAGVRSPNEAWRAYEAGDKTQVIPVYAVDGITVIGEFVVGMPFMK